jgi:PAS domain S-box-containing protein
MSSDLPRASGRRRLSKAEIDALRQRLDDAESTLNAIAGGQVDAVVVMDPVVERQVMLLEDATRGTRLPIDRLRQGAVTISAAGEILHVNFAFSALLGIEQTHLRGRPIAELVSPADRATLAALLSGPSGGPLAVLAFERPAAPPVRVRIASIELLDGRGACLLVTGIHESDDDEAAATVRAIRRGEIDALVVAEHEDDPQVLLLGAAGRRYRQFVEHMREGAVTLSDEGDVLYANPSFASMVGYLPSDLVGMRLADFVEERSRPLLEALRDGRRGGGSHAEVSISRRNGGTFRAILTPLPATDDFGTSLLVMDLTIRQRLDEAEETLRAIGSGEVDAFVVERDGAANEVQTLSGAHRPYRVMVERMQQGAVTLSASGDILYTNQPFADMLGHPLAGLIGMPLAQLVAPADRTLLAALVAAKHGAATQGELTLLQRDGGHVPVLVGVALLPEEGGVCLIVTDLTTQKAYEAMVAAQALERSILEQAVDAIVLCDLDGRVIRASRAALELCTRNPLLLPFDATFRLEGVRGAPDLSAVMRAGSTLRAEEYTLTRPGTLPATVLLSAGPVLDADGHARGCVVTMTDITERRGAEDRLRESDRHKDEFLAILAHELRNPLAPIRTAVEILRAADLSAHRHASYAVDIIGRQTGNLIRLVDDLLDINRINQGKIVLQIGLIDMRLVVEQAIETCRPLISSRNHALESRLPSEPVPVRGDLVRLVQVVVNLLTNAANYTPPGGRVEVGLDISAGSPGEAVVTVVDNGVGIPPEMVARIFEPYQQASQSRERATGGLGLGLTVCKRLIEMHGGTVEAHSEGSGRGARFVARIALAEASPGRRMIEEARPLGAVSLRVLIVDDNRDAAESLARLLQMSGHDVLTVTNGAAAIAHAASDLPDAVLLDIGMPGMDGYEVAQCLRELPGADQVLIIAMTGYGTQEDRRRSSENGIDHHLVKPLDFAHLERLLAQPR